jgi:hypothetical protein
MEELAVLAETAAQPQIAGHLHVYNDDVLWLQWFDICSTDPILISECVDQESLEMFCKSLKSTYVRDADTR